MPARPTSDVLDAMLTRHPDVRDALESAWEAAWASLDPVLLELCRLAIAMLLGCHDELAARTPAALAAGLDEAMVAALAGWPHDERFGGASGPASPSPSSS